MTSEYEEKIEFFQKQLQIIAENLEEFKKEVERDFEAGSRQQIGSRLNRIIDMLEEDCEDDCCEDDCCCKTDDIEHPSVSCGSSKGIFRGEFQIDRDC